MSIQKKIIVGVLAFVFLAPFATVLASNSLGGDLADDATDYGLVGCGGTDCNFSDFENFVGNIVEYVVAAAIILAGFMIGYAGFLFVVAAGDNGKISTAKKMIKQVLIGLVVVLAAFLIIKAILSWTAVNSDYKDDAFTGNVSN